MVKTKQYILAGYHDNVSNQQRLIDALKGQLNKISFSRLGLFVAEIGLVALIINLGFSLLLGILCVVPVILFMVLVKRQSAVQEELIYAIKLLWVYQNEVNHIETGVNGYNNGNAWENEQHPYASDLDVFGQGSLFSYINRCNTNNGLELLSLSLGQPADKDVINARQTAIKELTTHIEQTFHFRAALQDHKPEQLNLVKRKLEDQLPAQLAFVRKSWLQYYVRFVPVLTFGLFLSGVYWGGSVWRIFGLVALLNAGLTFFYLGAINKVYYGFSGSANLLNSFAGTIKWTEEVNWESKYIKDFFESPVSAIPVSRQIKQLAKIIQAFDARLNIFVSAFLNLFLLWDLRCSIRLNTWHMRSSGQLLQGLYRISQFEELISFATLTYNEPAWNFPVISDLYHLQVKELGHPLIHERERVVNDFNLALHPTVDIVTGSNMAGKSTFLRTIGVNMVLSYAGAPVCAKEMSLSIFKVLSYMRIKDSLNDHTSTFKAELNRLKMILDATQTGQNPFVLIDEMLRGTNSRDKYLGSKVFIERLIAQCTPALFATHDLQLSEMEIDHPAEIRNYHFDIQIIESEMKFDYKLKHGPCKTFNAALLLKEIGLTLN